MKPLPVEHHSTPSRFLRYSFITWKLGVKLAHGVRNRNPPIFTHIVKPRANKVWVSNSEALGLRLYVCVAAA